MYVISVIKETGLYKAFNLETAKKIQIKKRTTGGYGIMIDDEVAMVYGNYEGAEEAMNAAFDARNQGYTYWKFPA